MNPSQADPYITWHSRQETPIYQLTEDFTAIPETASLRMWQNPVELPATLPGKVPGQPNFLTMITMVTWIFSQPMALPKN